MQAIQSSSRIAHRQLQRIYLTRPLIKARFSPGSCVRAVTGVSSRNQGIRCQARKDDDGPSGLTTVTNTIQSAVNSIADLVPESVPRPAARTGVAIVGGLILFGLVKQVLSGLFTLVVLGGLGYWWLTKSGGGLGDDDDDFKPRKGTRQDANDDDDPLAESRRIMDKYK